MFFEKYKPYENKLSEQLSDSNPYKKKLIQMETPTKNHPIYTGLVWGLLIYTWVFFIVLIYNQTNQSILDNFKMVISTGNIIFVTFSIRACYKKDFLTEINPRYRYYSYIMFVLSVIFSSLISAADFDNATKTEVIETFFFFYTINSKSYIALAITSYIALGIAYSFYTCPYELYRIFYSINKTYKSYSNEKTLLNKWFVFCVLAIILYLPTIYRAFNPAKDSFADKLKLFSVAMTFISIPLCTAVSIGKMYYKYYEKAIKYQKGTL